MKSPIHTLICFFVCFFSPLKAQELAYGIKGGVESNFGGKISSSKEAFPTRIGWQAGAFVLIDYHPFFLQPEITYSSFKNSSSVFRKKDLTYQNDRLNLEVLVGKSFFEFFRIFIGPAIYFNLRDHLYLQRATPISKNKVGIAFDLGLGVKYLFLIAEMKYQRAIYHYQNSFSHNHQTYSLTPKANLLSLSLGIVF